jgi:hypothetical protein
MLEDGPSRTTPDHPRAFEWNAHVQGYARDMVGIIREALAPKRRGTPPKDEESGT